MYMQMYAGEWSARVYDTASKQSQHAMELRAGLVVMYRKAKHTIA